MMNDQTSNKFETVEDSPFIGQLHMPISAVARRNQSWGVIFGAMAIIVFGLLVFLSLTNSRNAQQQPVSTAGNNNGPVVAQASQNPVLNGIQNAPVLMPQVDAAQTPTLGENMVLGLNGNTVVSSQGMTGDKFHSPALVIDLGGNNYGSASGLNGIVGSVGPASPNTATAIPVSVEQEKSRLKTEGQSDRFSGMLSNGNNETIVPTRLNNNSLITPQGTIIPAIMETAINSDLPGYVRAIVSRDVHGFDGSTVLIPKGSHIIGQYRNAVVIGQSRAFVVWNRLLTPDGVSIDIQSPGTDRLGHSGLEGETNSHFLRRFGNSILLSVINAGLSAAANSGGNNTAIIIGSQLQASNIAAMALQKEIDIPPTVVVPQGSSIKIFVARDIDFSSIGAARR